MIKWKSYYIVIVMMSIGLIAVFFIDSKQAGFYNKLENIDIDKKYDIQVKEAYNERGIYILNNKYYLQSSTSIIGNHYGYSIDDAIWRLKSANYIPRISDISAPFRILKDIGSDTLKLEKENKTIILLLVND